MELHSVSLNNYLGIGLRWPNDTGVGDTPGLVKSLEQLTGRPLTSFSGCYEGVAFTLHD